MEKNKLVISIVGAVIVVSLIAGGVIISGSKKKVSTTQSSVSLPTEVFPTVDSSVRVTLTPNGDKKEVMLSIKGVPANTTSIDYAISYMTKDQKEQGISSIYSVPAGESTFERKFTLGTCSSGTCVYHQVEGGIKLDLKFSGSYGDKIFSKSYDL
ncbi:hypothetical protein HGB07_00385 [Candidatus Roizmanbacteria bacterium]|nr:hypothetical protein [Candidatus Roizmanbacteria bacterium]